MIRENNKETSSVHYGQKVITAIYKGGRLVWQGIKSCFGRGFWIGSKPWINSEIWKN